MILFNQLRGRITSLWQLTKTLLPSPPLTKKGATMTNLDELRDRVQVALSDAAGATWANATIEEWLTDAIRDYSKYLPRIVLYTYSSGSDYTEVQMPENFQAVVSVAEYSGSTRVRYLSRKAYDHEDFVNGNGYFYDVRRRRDVADGDMVVFSYTVPTANGMYIEYQADHEWSLIQGSPYTVPITVPARDEPILIQYCVWMAWRERTGKEVANPDTSTILLSQMDTNAGRQKRIYDQMIRDAINMPTGEMAASWKMDKWQGRY